MDWMAYFADFFRQKSERIQAMLDAEGCREGWLQGEFFLYARDLHLQTNTTRVKFDLLCPQPPMIAEIKICGGEYSQKMRGLIQDDVCKLARADGPWQRFMILVVDNRTPHTSLGQWLTACIFPNIQSQDVTLSKTLVVRMWQITEEAHQM